MLGPTPRLKPMEMRSPMTDPSSTMGRLLITRSHLAMSRTLKRIIPRPATRSLHPVATTSTPVTKQRPRHTVPHRATSRVPGRHQAMSTSYRTMSTSYRTISTSHQAMSPRHTCTMRHQATRSPPATSPRHTLVQCTVELREEALRLRDQGRNLQRTIKLRQGIHLRVWCRNISLTLHV
jgi:hypothetical protein